jgi:hypothetical protein
LADRAHAHPTDQGTIQLKVDAGSGKEYADTIEGRSSQLLVFEGDSLRKHTYASRDFDQGKPPVETIIR